MPSILSNAVPPVTMDTKTGQTGLEPVQHDYRTQSQLATYHEEGLNNPEPHPTTGGGRFRAGSVFSSRHRPRNLPRRSTVPALSTTHHSTQLSPRVRSTSQSSYQTTQTGLSSPRGDLTVNLFFKFYFNLPSTQGTLPLPRPVIVIGALVYRGGYTLLQTTPTLLAMPSHKATPLIMSATPSHKATPLITITSLPTYNVENRYHSLSNHLLP